MAVEDWQVTLSNAEGLAVGHLVVFSMTRQVKVGVDRNEKALVGGWICPARLVYPDQHRTPLPTLALLLTTIGYPVASVNGGVW